MLLATRQERHVLLAFQRDAQGMDCQPAWALSQISPIGYGCSDVEPLLAQDRAVEFVAPRKVACCGNVWAGRAGVLCRRGCGSRRGCAYCGSCAHCAGRTYCGG